MRGARTILYWCCCTWGHAVF